MSGRQATVPVDRAVFDICRLQIPGSRPIAFKETVAVRSDKPLMVEIKKGLLELKKKKAKLYTLEELFS